MTDNSKQTVEQKTPAPKRPNDVGSISVEGFIKIFDPKTKETFVEKRA